MEPNQMPATVEAEARAVAERVTARSGSNLAFAFFTLPRERARDGAVFYAFCRVVDDIVDEPGRTDQERRVALELWKTALRGPVQGEHALAPAVRGIIERYALNLGYFDEIIAGMEMDLEPVCYPTWEALRVYCYRVAGVVGLVSARLFGAVTSESEKYAVALGLALQTTNIIRDVREDFGNEGRVYLPRDEMAAHGVTESMLRVGVVTAEFASLMRAQIARSRQYYRDAAALLPEADRLALIPAETMRRIYSGLLDRVERVGLDVFRHRVRMSKLGKVGCGVAAWAAANWANWKGRIRR